MITQERLKELFRYNPDTGEFFWRVGGKGRDVVMPAGTLTNKGYIVLNINYERYVAHKLAWLYVHGKYPGELDHIDGNSANNRIVNLRESTHSQNLMNAKTRTDNTSGHKGVCWDYQKSKWKVQVGPAGKRQQKHFDNFKAACEWQEAKSKELFGEFDSRSSRQTENADARLLSGL